MRISEIKKKAKTLGINIHPAMKKTEIVWAIQKKEGNFDCFGTATDHCDQEKCWFREDCLSEMSRKILIILVVGIVIFWANKSSFAMMCGAHGGSAGGHSGHAEAAETDSSTQKVAEDAGNKICPVSNEEINKKAKSAYEYKGKAYNFCCPACIDEFKKDPEKYIEKIERQENTEEEQQHKHQH